MRVLAALVAVFLSLTATASAQDDVSVAEQGERLHGEFTRTMETLVATVEQFRMELGDQRRLGYDFAIMEPTETDFDGAREEFRFAVDDLKAQADQAREFLSRDGSPRVGGSDNRLELFEAIANLYPVYDAVFARYLAVRAYNEIGRELIAAREEGQADLAKAVGEVYRLERRLPRDPNVEPDKAIVADLERACRAQGDARVRAGERMMDALVANTFEYMALSVEDARTFQDIKRDLERLVEAAQAAPYTNTGAGDVVYDVLWEWQNAPRPSYDLATQSMAMLGPWPGGANDSEPERPQVSSWFVEDDCFGPDWERHGGTLAYIHAPPVEGLDFENADIDKLFANSAAGQAQLQGEIAWGNMDDTQRAVFLRGVARMKDAQARLAAAVKAYEGGDTSAIEEGSAELWQSAVESTRAVSDMIRANAGGELSPDLLAATEDLEEPLVEGASQVLRYGGSTIGDALGLSGKFASAAEKVKAMKPFLDSAKRLARAANLIDQTLKGAYESDPQNYFSARLSDLAILGPRVGAAALNTSMALRVPQIPQAMVRRTVQQTARQYETAASALEGISRQLEGDTVGGQEQIDAAINSTKNLHRDFVESALPTPVVTVVKGVTAARSKLNNFGRAVKEAFFGPSSNVPPPPSDGPVDEEFRGR